MLTLHELQHWFAAAMVERRLDYELLPSLVVGDEQLNAERRLYIYAQGYRLRLLECMRAEFGCLAAVLGEELFDQFSMMYLSAHPSRSWTLFDLGEDFAGLLQRTRPEDRPELRLPEQLARLEYLIGCSVRGRGTEQQKLPSLDPVGMIMGQSMLLRLADTSAVMTADFDLAALVNHWQLEEELLELAVQPVHLLIRRTDYRVQVELISYWQYQLLQQCAVEMDSNKAIQRVLTAMPDDERPALVEVAGWLAACARQGVFVY